MRAPAVLPVSLAIGLAAALVTSVSADPGIPGSHLWRFNEVFSNADGSIQFIELLECCGADNEIFLMNKDITAHQLNNVFLFPENLPCTNCTANQHLLLATQAFADLPGAPTPDYIIPENFIALTQAELLTYWLYGDATMSWNAFELPLGGLNSLAEDGTVAVNSPTNFAGEMGTVEAPCTPADVTFDGTVNVLDLLAVLTEWGRCDVPCYADIDDSGSVNVLDLLGVLTEWGDCR